LWKDKLMNKILLGINAILVAAVAFLFFKVNSLGSVKEEVAQTPKEDEVKTKPVPRLEPVGNIPTGKIAFVNIDKLNEESTEISDLVAETKRRKTNIEASVESLSMQYQKKVEEFQMSQKAGIASQAEMEAKAREIQSIEKEAENKQLQMDNLSMDINEKNNSFQKSVRDFLIKWNNGRFDYILSYSEAVPSMLLGNTTLEVTDEIIQELNSDYKKRKGKK
jgi:outer membrane protein